MERYVLVLALTFLALVPVRAHEGRRPSLPPVFLDHVYLVLDRDTYADLAASDFMRNEFAGFTQKTSTIDDEPLSAAYISGLNTYLEIFEAGSNPRFGQGMIGIAFNTDSAEATRRLLQHLNGMFADRVKTDLSTLAHEGKEIPFFHATYVDDGEEWSNPATWVMQYHKDYFRTRFPEEEHGGGEDTRRKALSHLFKSDRYLRDIYEVTIALDDAQASRLVGELEAFGYTITMDGRNRICKGADVTFIVSPLSASPGGITALKMSLQRRKAGQKTFTFGAKSTLQFEDEIAVWTF